MPYLAPEAQETIQPVLVAQPSTSVCTRVLPWRTQSTNEDPEYKSPPLPLMSKDAIILDAQYTRHPTTWLTDSAVVLALRRKIPSTAIL